MYAESMILADIKYYIWRWYTLTTHISFTYLLQVMDLILIRSKYIIRIYPSKHKQHDHNTKLICYHFGQKWPKMAKNGIVDICLTINHLCLIWNYWNFACRVNVLIIMRQVPMTHFFLQFWLKIAKQLYILTVTHLCLRKKLRKLCNYGILNVLIAMEVGGKVDFLCILVG